jgi:hypothetical protein
LRSGEEAELLAFAQAHTPRLYSVMSALRRRSPERLRERLGQFAPRLRHLRRLYEQSPRLGQIVQVYAENLFEMQRGVRALRQTPAGSASYADERQELRKLVGNNVRLESDALAALAEEVEEHRAERVAERMSYLLSDDADVAAAPEHVRNLVAAVRAARDDSERERAGDRLRDALAREVSQEVRALRERVERRRQDVTAEVDRRMERLLDEREPERVEPREATSQPSSRP